MNNVIARAQLAKTNIFNNFSIPKTVISTLADIPQNMKAIVCGIRSILLLMVIANNDVAGMKKQIMSVAASIPKFRLPRVLLSLACNPASIKIPSDIICIVKLPSMLNENRGSKIAMNNNIYKPCLICIFSW